MIRLTGDEQLRALDEVRRKALDDGITPDRAQEDKALLTAQLKKVVEWGDEPCKEHIGQLAYNPRPTHSQCPWCWQALLEEVKDVL